VAAREGKWVLQTLVYDYAGQGPGFTEDGDLAGKPTAEDIEVLVEALAKLGEATGQALDKVQVPPSEFTVEGHIAIQVSAGLPTVVTFGVETGISISMTWEFTQTAVRPMFGPRHT
jgi:hypothetical protein